MSESSHGSTILGFHHLALTVSDVARSVPWYCETLGLEKVGQRQHDEGATMALAPHDGAFVLVLQEHKAHEGASFSEFRPGLDHLSFRVADVRALHAWQRRLTELNVEHSPVRCEPTGYVLVFRDPDRIQLELFVDPPP